MMLRFRPSIHQTSLLIEVTSYVILRNFKRLLNGISRNFKRLLHGISRNFKRFLNGISRNFKRLPNESFPFIFEMIVCYGNGVMRRIQGRPRGRTRTRIRVKESQRQE